MGKKRTSDEVGTPEAKLPINRLEDRQFEILKQEIGLLEGRIIHLEGLQYRLRQFSILLWSMILTVGFGVTKLLADADARLIAASLGVPLVFGFLDAWYARAAQRFRTRRVEIAEYFNSTDDKPIVYPITLLDMMASQRRKEDPRARYRENLLTKLTRTVRVTFYGFQLFGSAVLLAIFAASGYASRWYLLLVAVIVVGVFSLVLANMIVSKRWRKKYPMIQPIEFTRKTEEPFTDHANGTSRNEGNTS